MRIINQEIVETKVSELKVHPDNPRQGNVNDIANSIEVNGFYGVIVAQKSSGYVLAGNHRLKAAKAQNATKIPVAFVDCTDEQAKRIMLADNRHSDLAAYDNDVLLTLLEELQNTEMGLDGTGYDDSFFDEILTTFGKNDQEEATDETPEKPENPTTQKGDLWILGNHRLLCGDSTKENDVKRLFDGQLADLVFTSPPYALGASASLSGNKAMAKRGNAYKEHDDNSQDWFALMQGFYSAFLPHVQAFCVNVQSLAGNKANLFLWIADKVNHLADVAIWSKTQAAPMMAKNVFTSQFEFLLFFDKNNSSRSLPFADFQGTISNIYEGGANKENKFADVHGAAMPSHLPRWVLSEVCKKAKTVVEPFCGTGTTLVVCEELQKTCYAMEMDPVYCDVTVQRWEEYTGKKAKREQVSTRA